MYSGSRALSFLIIEEGFTYVYNKVDDWLAD